MKLYLIQHGEAYSKEENPQRPLTEKGITDVKKIAMFLQQAKINPECIIHSGKLRAEQTAKILADTIAPNSELEKCFLFHSLISYQ